MLKVEIQSPAHNVKIDIHRTADSEHYIDTMALNGYPLTMNYDELGHDRYGGLSANEQTILVLDALTQYSHLTAKIWDQFVHTTGINRRSVYAKLQLPVRDEGSELGAMAIERVVQSGAIMHDRTAADLCMVSPECALLPDTDYWRDTFVYAYYFREARCWSRLAEAQGISPDQAREEFKEFQKRTYFINPANLVLRSLLFQESYQQVNNQSDGRLSLIH